LINGGLPSPPVSASVKKHMIAIIAGLVRRSPSSIQDRSSR
jgi:hypothetical protein